MPLKTKPTTRLERRLLKQVADLEKRLATQTTIAKECAESVTKQKKKVESNTFARSEGYRAAQSEIHERRVVEYMAASIMRASDMEAENAEKMREQCLSRGMREPDAANIVSQASWRLKALAQFLSEGGDLYNEEAMRPNRSPHGDLRSVLANVQRGSNTGPGCGATLTPR